MDTKLERPVAYYPYFYFNKTQAEEQCICDRSDLLSMMSSSTGSCDLDGPPETKRFRIDVNTQVGIIDAPSTTCSITTTPVAGEASQDGQSPAAPSSASYRSSNSSVISSSESPIKEEEMDTSDLQLQHDETDGSVVGGASTGGASIVNNSEIFEMLNKTFGGVFGNCDLEGMMRPAALLNPPSPPTPVPTGIPGALAVAQTPAAQLFANDDWSWHRNPAASIRSGGTNKQTPVWKYFVYNKAENLSRCIVGDCTYMLKGPHTSTLACHLKKHTKEYSEFQKLKTEYSRTKMEQQPKVPEMTTPSPMAPMNLQSLPARQTISPVSSTSNSSASGVDLSMKKAAKNKEIPIPSSAKLNEMILNGFRGGVAAPISTSSASNSTSVPSFVTNMMLQMNPLHMMLAQSLPTTAQPPATGGGGGAQQQSCGASQIVASTNALAISLAANGQLVQSSKKWRSDEKKQKELGTRLALALATSHIPCEVLQNPLWKEVFEMAQPKFSLPSEQVYEAAVSGTVQKLTQTVKSALAANKKLNLLLDVTKVTGEIARLSVAAAITGGAGNAYETQVVLLAFRNISQSVGAENENLAEDVANAFERVLEDYKISEDSVNRVVCSGLPEFVGDDAGHIVSKQMESFASKLSACFRTWLDTSPTLELFKKNIYSMLLSYLTVPAAIHLASQMIKTKFELPVTEPFPVIIENLITHRDIYQMNLEGLAPISEREWVKVMGIHQVMNIFKPLTAYTTEMTTVDTVIPTIVQLRNALEKDTFHLGEVGSDLLASLNATFAPITSPNHEEFDSTYIQATALNPQLAVTLTAEQMSLAKSLIEKEVSRRSRKSRSHNEKKLAMGVDSLLANVMKKEGAGGEEALAIYGDLFQSIKGESIVNQYFEEISSATSVESIFTPLLRTFGNPMQAPLAYWKSCSSRCSELSELAAELLSIPIFTLTAERVLTFSATATSTALNTNLILTNLDTVEQFEKQILLRFNRQIVAKLLN
ncbi:unnamed protein product [Caenorhabditis sp. 36 PRJEB53466]|nr:unnamed protein product [Caenorhabditis sp. 36 PRJEB53466]